MRFYPARSGRSRPVFLADSSSRLRTQQGQVMPMTVIFIVAVILALWVMYDSGVVMGERMRIQNTSDNVAYSTATLVARDLNFIAYTNRGMMANQAAIGQMVGLSSWAAMVNELATNADEIGDRIPIIKPYTSAIAAGTQIGADAMDRYTRFMIGVNEGIIEVISEMQALYHGATVLAIPEFSQDVAHRNDPHAESVMKRGDYSLTEAAVLVTEWNKNIGRQFKLERLSDSEEPAQLSHQRFREFETSVKESRDDFTRRRSYEWGKPFRGPGEDKIPGPDWETRKYGGSDFFRSVDPDEDTYRWDWGGMDTAGLYSRFCYYEPDPPGPPKFTCTSWTSFDLPLAWGAAHVLDESKGEQSFFNYGDRLDADYFDPTDGRSRSWRRRWGNGTWRNSAASTCLVYSRYGRQFCLFESEDHVNHKLREVKGLRDFHDFQKDGSDEFQHDLGPAIVALYVKEDGDIGKQRAMIEGRGGRVHEDFDTERRGGLLDGRIGAVAKAQPYFARPTDLTGWARTDRRFEHGNLYNPFWQARLVELTDTEKFIATAIVTGTEMGGGEEDE